MRTALLMLSLCLGVAACDGDDVVSAGPDAGVPDEQEPVPSAPRCDDGIRNGDETDVDCGGTCGATCAIDASCASLDDCAPGGICAVLPSTTEVTDASLRTCRPRIASCAEDCGPDAYCDIFSSDDRERILVCAVRAPIGALCAPTGGTGDEAINPCVDHAACVRDEFPSFDSHCRAALPEGAACSDDRCDAGLFCSSGACKPLREVGERCLNSEDCATDLFCDPTDRCVPRIAFGESCTDVDRTCVTGASCVFAAGLVCTEAIDCFGRGRACCATDTGSECRILADGETCAPPTGICQ